MNRNEALKILGLEATATPEEAKKAFRRLAVKYHPDRNDAPDAEQKFKEVNEAFQTLENPPERRFTPPGWPHATQSNIHNDFQDLFNFVQHQTVKIEIAQADVSITFKESIIGCQKTIEYKRNIACDVCNATGFKFIPTVPTCQECKGAGSVVKEYNIRGVCPSCQGRTGQRISCQKCNGKCIIATKSTYNVQIPPGCDTGTTLKLPRAGNFVGGFMGQSNYMDAILHVTVEQSPKFKRSGADVTSECNISMLQAIKGCQLKEETVYGEIEIVVPPMSKNKEEVVLQNMGIRTKNGSHRFILKVDYPDASMLDEIVAILSPKQEEAK